MDVLIYIFANVVLTFLSLLQLAMLARAILSMFMADGGIVTVLNMLTEPFILPVRLLFKKLNLFQGSPFDFSGMTTMIIISLVILLLP